MNWSFFFFLITLTSPIKIKRRAGTRFSSRRKKKITETAENSILNAPCQMMKNTRIPACTFLINPRNIRPALHIPITHKHAAKKRRERRKKSFFILSNIRRPSIHSFEHVNLNFTLHKTPRCQYSRTTSCHDSALVSIIAS